MTAIALAVVGSALAFLAVIVWGVRAVLVTLGGMRQANDAVVADLVQKVEAGQGGAAAVQIPVNDRVDALGQIVREAVERMEALHVEVRRLDGRARYAVRSHLKKLEQIGIEPDELVAGAAAELQLVDGGGGDPEGVLPMHEDLEGHEAQPDPDWRARALAKKWG